MGEKIKKVINFIDSNRALSVIILIILMFSIWFYWAQIRPSEIYSKCNRVAGGRGGTAYDRVYEACLNENGLR